MTFNKKQLNNVFGLVLPQIKVNFLKFNKMLEPTSNIFLKKEARIQKMIDFLPRLIFFFRENSRVYWKSCNLVLLSFQNITLSKWEIE